MPLTVNVGLSRKSSHNYASQGVSLNLTAEMDQALLAHPGRLQQEIAALYHHVEAALARQEAEAAGPEVASGRQGPRLIAGRAATTGNGTAERRGARERQAGPYSPQARDEGSPPATASQIRALRALCRRLETDLDQAAEDELGVPADQLDIRQASRLIDALKARGVATSRERGA